MSHPDLIPVLRQILFPSLEAPGDFADLNFLLGWIPFRHCLGCGLNCPVGGFLHVLYDIQVVCH